MTTTRCVPATPLVWMRCAQSPTLHGVTVVDRTITPGPTARLLSTPSVHVQHMSVPLCPITRSARRERYTGGSPPASCVMYIFLDQITHRYPGVPSPALAGVSLFVRSGEIAAVVGLPGAGKSTLLRIIAAHGDNVLIGSADHREPGAVKPGIVRGWRFCDPWDIFPPRWKPEAWRGVPILRYAFPNMALDGAAREPPGCYGAPHVDSEGVVHSPPPWQGPPPNDDDLPDLLLVDDLVGNPAFADAAARCACVRDLYGLRARPEYRTVIYATRDGEDALAVADRIAVLHDGRIVQCGTPAEVHDTPVTEHVARLFSRRSARRSSRA